MLVPTRPLEPIVVAHTSSGYELISVCGSAIVSASVQQPPEYGPAVTFSWQADADGTPSPQLLLFAESIDGYRIAVEGVRDSATEVLLAADTVDDIEAGLAVDLDSIAIGQVAYQKGVVSSSEFEQLPKTGFGCRP
ncbi:hypothetical protein ATK74_2318 [Propionicimonas paludicola]|uniref:Uncharacterized protein n=2 Tax=Propionicimonas paludicola TaxID=185243 RepID=A0A2A9CUL8_9ACTN|nr:hypothetical protein ATK74_2318 [Propionicimonas paludicola]